MSGATAAADGGGAATGAAVGPAAARGVVVGQVLRRDQGGRRGELPP
ncbi:hypothetical protein THAOC_26377, partial [Thalassiosira oceanica]